MVYFYLIELRTILSHENFLCIINLPCKKVGYVLPPLTHLLLHCFNPIIWKQNRTGVIMMRIIWTMMKMKWNEDNTKVMMIWMRRRMPRHPLRQSSWSLGDIGFGG